MIDFGPHTQAIETIEMLLNAGLQVQFSRFNCSRCGRFIPEPLPKFTEVRPEYRLKFHDLTFIADIALLDQEQKPCFIIEVLHTHRVDDVKASCLDQMGIPWIEVNCHEINSQGKLWSARNHWNKQDWKAERPACSCASLEIIPVYTILHKAFGLPKKVPCPQLPKLKKLSEPECVACPHHRGIVRPEQYESGVLCAFTERAM